MKHNDSITQVGTNSSSLSFNSLKLSDIGLYNCHININYNHMFNVNVKSKTDFEIQLPGINYITVTKQLISVIVTATYDAKLMYSLLSLP